MSRNYLSGSAKSCVAVALAWAAGYIDVASWLVLFHVYPSHMSGNTASFAHDIVAVPLSQALDYGLAILSFVLGLLYGAATTKLARRHGIHSSFSIALCTELFLLSMLLLLGLGYMNNGKIEAPRPWIEYLLLALPCAAMGMQTVTVTRINGLRVYTTYVTGTLSKCAEAVVDFIFWCKDRIAKHHPMRLKRVLLVALRQKSIHHAALTSALWSGFFGGAICGALLQQRYSIFSLVLPMSVISVAVIVDLVSPVSAADEPPELDSAH